MTRTNNTGRPTSYSNDDLAKAVAFVEAEGDAPTKSAVKGVLCGHLKISDGINDQSLEKALDRFLKDRAERRLREQIAVLPEAVKNGARELAEAVEKAILAAQAPLFADMRENAAKELEAEKKARASLVRQNDDLVEAAANSAEEQARLRNELRVLRDERANLEARLEEANRRIEELEKAGDLRVELERMIRETLGREGMNSAPSAA